MNLNKTYITIILFILFFVIIEKIEAQIAVVVNKDNPVENLTSVELKRIYLGRITTFINDEQIMLVQYEPLSEKFYHLLLHKTPMKVRKHWISVVFSGGDGTPPKESKTVEQVFKLIKENPGAISFLDLNDVSNEMKLLTIDRKQPQDDEYFFK